MRARNNDSAVTRVTRYTPVRSQYYFIHIKIISYILWISKIINVYIKLIMQIYVYYIKYLNQEEFRISTDTNISILLQFLVLLHIYFAFDFILYDI